MSAVQVAIVLLAVGVIMNAISVLFLARANKLTSKRVTELNARTQDLRVRVGTVHDRFTAFKLKSDLEGSGRPAHTVQMSPPRATGSGR